jgi:hypothetical protein
MGYHTSGGAALSFSDTLLGSDRPFYIGDDWDVILTATSTVAPTRQAADLNIGGTGLTFGDGGGSNDNGLSNLMLPNKIDTAKVRALSLTNGIFAQWQFVSRPVAGVDCGPALIVGANAGGEKGYGLRLQSINTDSQLVRGLGFGGADAVAQLVANCFTANPGDIMRIELNFAPTQNTIRSYQNGVLQNTFVDNNALRPTAGGLFGMSLLGVFTGQVTVKNFSGGVLSPT